MFLAECWKILCELAPWLLLGMLLSGVMHVLLPKDFIRKRLQGAAGVLKAVLLGVPLPLCSCGVIPAGIGLKNQGASSGAAVGFLISTPQTGVDSILVSASFFGWPFAIFKMVTAAITGVVGGWLTDALESDRGLESHRDRVPTQQAASGGSSGLPPALEEFHGPVEKLVGIWVHGIEILRSIWLWLAVGILISAVIETFVPEAWFATVGNWGLLTAMLLTLVISIPLYVCATASVPIAAAIVHGGLPPAAALVFLMAGPATNITTIGAIQNRFGWKTLTVYLSTLILGSMLFAWLFDWLLTATVTEHAGHAHDHRQDWWAVASAGLLLLIGGYFVWERWVRFTRRVQPAAGPREEQIQISVAGMTCGNCVNRLESQLRKNQKIESVYVQLKPGLATVTGTASRKEIQTIIEAAGFRTVNDESQ